MPHLSGHWKIKTKRVVCKKQRLAQKKKAKATRAVQGCNCTSNDLERSKAISKETGGTKRANGTQ